ncbi:DUF805 domain-containing protein [Shimia litoralis]|nr:DUF805 domain-containing protein [Shimia litoralis]
MMGPIAAIESVIFKYFKFTGRAPRSEYWWWMLAQQLVLLASIWADVRMLMHTDAPPLNPLEYTSFLVSLVTFIPSLMVTIRRLHDTGRSGFWWFIVLIPFVGPLILLVFMILPSMPDDNIHGTPYRKAGQWSGKANGKRDPMQAYAILDHLHDEPDAGTVEARKAEIKEYYKTRVLSAQ